jgi:hypothetical protein
MAQAVISNKPVGNIKSAKTSGFGIFKAVFKPLNTKVTNVDHTTKYVKTSDYAITTIANPQPTIKVTEVLPFRVKFTTIGIDSYGPGNAPPIGIAVIGINNYIL